MPGSSMSVSSDTPILRAIAYGRLAPNPHNTQAWKIVPSSDTKFSLLVDERRLLLATDPAARQIHIGAGCFLETLAVGMSRHGYRAEVDYLPQGAHGLEEVGRKPVAHIALRATGTAPDELADAIDLRQTNRKPFTGPFINSAEADRLKNVNSQDDVEVSVVREPALMRPLLDVFDRALQIEINTRHTYEETRQWFRFSERERRARRDGLSVRQLGIDGLRARLTEWILHDGDPKRWFSKLSRSATLKDMRRGIYSARGFVLLKTATNDQLTWLIAGRTFARVHLALTQLGLTCHPYSQVLQEFPEMSILQAEFNQLLGVQPPAKIQMAVRVGRAARAYRAPRRDPRDFLHESR